MTNSTPYLALARKYRPTTLGGLIGQDALRQTLSNAIAAGRIPQALLLTGIRGTGKTSTARILARALNCEQGPTVDPCGICPQCRAIGADNHLDIIEIDAASHTGVDDIREITDTSRYAPVQGRHKIFIIDEAHMLSKNAFNALLKTLEEPPASVVFVLATTEARKVPATIISRCQRFDLRRVEAETLKRHFAGICEQEKVRIDEDALGLIAEAADGSVRDGLSLLDQAISQQSGNVTGQGIRGMLGMVEKGRAIEIADALLGSNPQLMLQAFRSAHQAGADVTGIVRDILDYLHFICVLAVSSAKADDVTLSETQKEVAATHAKRFGAIGTDRCWQILHRSLSDIHAAHDSRQATEMALIRAAAAMRQAG